MPDYAILGLSGIKGFGSKINFFKIGPAERNISLHLICRLFTSPLFLAVLMT